MTLQALPQPQQVWQPTAGYHVSALAEESQPNALRVVGEASDEYWSEFWGKSDRLMKLEVPTPPPNERLRRYQNKPTQEQAPVPPLAQVNAKGQTELVEQAQPPLTGSWIGQEMDFPRDYAEDMADWVALEPVSVRRDQVLRETAALKMALIGNAGMNAPAQLPAPQPTSGQAPPLPPLAWG